MTRQTMLLAFLSASLLLLASCASPQTYVSPEARLQRQIDAIVALDDAMSRAQTEQQRNAVQAQKISAIRDGILLLRELNTGLIASNQACIEQESRLSSDNTTCTESQRLDATQSLLMVMLLEQLNGHAGTE